MPAQRRCSNCRTEFNEILGIDVGIVDPIPECWRNNKENGHCINCCNCEMW